VEHSLRIVIPAYNEQDRIEATLDDYCTYFREAATILVVANGCTDETVATVRALQVRYENLLLLEIPFAVGKGGAVRLGLMSGRERLIGFTDADGSTPARSFATLVDACEREPIAGAIGSRWLKTSDVRVLQPLRRRIASRVLNLLVKMLFGLKYTDTQCGAKVFTSESIAAIFPKLELSNFAFDVDVLYAIRQTNYRIVELPVTWTDSSAGSKVRIARTTLEILMGLLRLRLRTGIFRSLPYVDYIARSNVIVAKSTFAIVVVLDRRRTPEAICERAHAWVGEARAAGHRVKLIELKTMLGGIEALGRYFGRGHAEYDLIVDVDERAPWWFVVVSSKARVSSDIFFAPSMQDALENLTAYFGFSQFFFRGESQDWRLVGGYPRKTITHSQVSGAPKR